MGAQIYNYLFENSNTRINNFPPGSKSIYLHFFEVFQIKRLIFTCVKIIPCTEVLSQRMRESSLQEETVLSSWLRNNVVYFRCAPVPGVHM